MKYLDEGFQYKVYLIDDKRVLKKEISYPKRLLKIFKISRSRGFLFFDSMNKSIVSDRKNKQSLFTMMEKLKILPLDMFANPKFVKDSLDFTQDKVEIIDGILGQFDDAKAKKIIDEYVDLQKKFWSYGIHDAVYKFQPNYGINSNGKLVCIDFGEFVFTKEEVLKSMEKQGWLRRSAYRNWEDSDMKRYYAQKMSECMTAENVKKYWSAEKA
jgi:hypothetical protein